MLNLCPCCSGKSFELCCSQFINKNQTPNSAEQLMRSRYSAYTLKEGNYLLASWDESTRPETLELENDTTQWKQLKIISSSKDTVTFVAYFTQNTLNKDKMYALTETSYFIKKEKWLYLDGENVNTVQLTKNMLCPCKSGKKYKRCCGKEESL